MNIDKFKRDHADILTNVTHLRSLVQSGVSQNAEAIAKSIVSMSAVIKTHLAAEDRVLYPAVLNSSDNQTVKVGKLFQAEMGGIAAAYMEFSGKWNLESKVLADPEGFRSDANNIFKALFLRIQRENQELYPLAEAT